MPHLVLLALLAGLCPLSSVQDPSQEADAHEPKVTVVHDEHDHPVLRITETIIGYNDPAMNEESFLPSEDGRRVAYMVMAGDGIAVVVDGEKGEVFEGLAENSLVFSPDGKHFGYVGTRPGSQIVVYDGVLHDYRGVSIQGIVFSSDSAHVGWVGIRDEHQIAVIDGVESPPYDGISSQGIVFSPDGKRWAYSATTGGKSLVVLDGEDGELFDSVAGLGFTHHGQHAYYVGLRDGKRFAVIDNRVEGPFDEIRPAGNRAASKEKDKDKEEPQEVFEVSADGSNVGFIATRGNECFVHAGSKTYGPYQGCTGLSISPEGSRVTFLATRGEGWFMVVDGQEQTGYSFQSLSFSPDGRRLASTVKRGTKYLALIDGAEGKEYDRIEHPGVRFSADGTHTAYMAQDGGELFVVEDGKEGPRFKAPGTIALGFVPGGSQTMYSIRRGSRESLVIDGIEGPAVKTIRSLTFSEGGKRYAYAGEIDKDAWVVVVDGERFGPGGKLAPSEDRTFSSVGKRTPLFSPDGTKAAWVAVRDTGWVAVVDGVESRPYNLVMRSTLDFSPDGEHVAFVAAREGKKMIVVDGREIDNQWDGFLQRSDFVWEGPRKFSIRGTRNPQYLLIEVELL